MTNRAKWLLAILSMTGMAGTVYAQNAGSGSPQAGPSGNPGPGDDRWHHDGDRDGGHDGWHHDGHHRHHGHRGMNGMMVHLLHQLNLTDAQKQIVHKILADAQTQEEARRTSGPKLNIAALANPGDPKHAAALQDFQTRMAARIKAEDQIHQQIYGVLTPDQRIQLAATLATRQARMSQRSAAG